MSKEETDKPIAKRAKIEGGEVSCCPFLDLLDDDVLRAVLLRTRASDHPNLRQTCRRVNDILNSSVFRKERGDLGYAEVEVKLLSPFEQYTNDYEWEAKQENRSLTQEDEMFHEYYDDLGHMDPDYGTHNLHSGHFRILVDGIRLGKNMKIGVYLLRGRSRCFYEMCDSYSETAPLIQLFTNKGKPQVASLKNGFESSNGKGILCISDFELPHEYRSLTSTVGPKILRTILTGTALKGRWSLAIYIPFCTAQMTIEEAKEYEEDKENFVERLGRDPSPQEEAEKERKEQRYEELTLQDMRHFFRAGFSQVNDISVVMNSSHYFVYTTPVDISKPIRTESEASKKSIACHPQTPTPKTGTPRELLDLIRASCSKYNYEQQQVKQLRKPITEMPVYQHLCNARDKTRETIREAETALQSTQAMQVEIGRWIEMTKELPDGDELKEVVRGNMPKLCAGLGVNAPPTDLALSLAALQRKAAENEQTMSDGLQQLRRSLLENEAVLEDGPGSIQEEAKRSLHEGEEKLKAMVTEIKSSVEVLWEKDDKNPHQIILQSNAIHACVANKTIPLLEMLLDLLPDTKARREAINSFDDNGLTPMMVAASVTDRSSIENGADRSLIECLLQLGADKNVLRAIDGLSPLGFFRQNVQDWNASEAVFGWNHGRSNLARYEEIGRMETLLEPDFGATPADEAALDQNADEDSESSDDEDEDSDDEDEDSDGEDEDSNDEDDDSDY